jgi:NTE family protein
VSKFHHLRSRRIGIALSGGSVRGLAHIGVLKVLSEAGIRPSIVTGTSAGSLVGALFASGMSWSELKHLAENTFWPKLLRGEGLQRFCAKYLPRTFAELELPFAAVTTEIPTGKRVLIRDGELASAISASCAMRILRRHVVREGKRLKDGGFTCVLPSEPCRVMGANFIVGSDVWEVSSALRSVGIAPHHPRVGRSYPSHYHCAINHTDVLISPKVPLSGYVPSPMAVEKMISAGEMAAWSALTRFAACNK